jgi:hypothetical protein
VKQGSYSWKKKLKKALIELEVRKPLVMSRISQKIEELKLNNLV